MAVLESIRNKFGILITALIAVALLSFIIDPSSLSLFSSNEGAEETKVASINGHDVTYTEFNDQLSLLNDIYPYEIYEANVLAQNPEVNTNDIKKAYNEEMRAMAMNYFLMNDLYVAKAKKAGFNVSEEEMYQLLSGQIFSNTIYTQFQGMMTPEVLKNMEENADKRIWGNIKESVEQERYTNKYYSAFEKSAFANSLLAEENIKNANNVFDVEFVMVPFETVGDTTIVVSDKEIKDYYNAHKNIFTTIETRELDYIVVDVNAENEDVEYAKIDSVLYNVKNVEAFRKAAIDNGYSLDSTPVTMYANALGSVTGVENIIKWAFKESSANVVSDIYTIDNDGESYLVVVALGKINPAGYASVDDLQVRYVIENLLYREKLADKQLAEVKEKINGLTDLKAIAAALETNVSTKKDLTFASSDFDAKFTGAASVAKEGELNAPLKGTNGIYVYKVTNRSVQSFYTEDDAMMEDMRYNLSYSQELPRVITEGGNITDYTYLYF